MPKFALILVALAALFTGCAKDQAPQYTSAGSYGSAYELSQPQSTLVSALDRAPLTCIGTCPQDADKVGMIGMAVSEADYSGNRKVGQCSGFLVAKNIVATNAHCLPPDELLRGNCGDVMAIKFLRADSKGVSTYGCKEVLAHSDYLAQADGPDFAYFRIDAPERQPVPVARNGIADQSKLRGVRVTPLNQTNFGGLIEETSCPAVQGSILNLRFASDWAPTALALGCPIAHGNSGSPVFNDQGEAVGIAQSLKLEGYLKLLERDLSQLGTEYPKNPPPHFVFTNLSCLPDAETGTTLNRENCEAKKKETIFSRLKKQELVQNSVGNSDAIFNDWLKKLPSFAVYKISFNPAAATFTALPKCLRPLAQWPTEVTATEESQGLVWRSRKFTARFDADLTMRGKLGLESSLRFRKAMEFSSATRTWIAELSFPREGGPVESDFYAAESVTGMHMPLGGARWCREEELAAGNDVSDLQAQNEKMRDELAH